MGIKKYIQLSLYLSVICFCEDYEPIDIKVVDGNIAEINGEPKTEFKLKNEYWYAHTIGAL